MKKAFVFLFFIMAFGVYGLQNEMAYIEGGAFLIGSPEDESGRSEREGPQHQVTVSSFYIGRFPVTGAEYEDVMGVNPSFFKGTDLPVEQVSWFDAIEYCNRRSLKEGLTPAYTISGNNVIWNRGANGYRLPTEAEWEYACRAGADTPFYSGDSVDAAGWHSGSSGRRTRPVGEKEPNAWGLYDMHGNVLEWCWDWLGNYADSDETDPQGPPSGTSRVYRGGCWQFGPNQLRSAYRFGNHANMRSFLVGFRVVRSGN